MSKIFKLHRDGVFADFAHSAAVVDTVVGADRARHRRLPVPVHLQDAGAWGQPWHQDSFYFPFDPARPVVGVWLAVTEATLANGCLHVLPGSQSEPVHTHVPDRRPGANYGYFEIVDHDMAASEPVLMDPGDLLVFDSHLMHCSTDNESDGIRAAMVYHYAMAGTVDHTEEYFPTVNDWVPARRDGLPTAPRRHDAARDPVALKFDAMLPAQPLRQAGDLGQRAAAAGLSGLVVTEAGRTAYLTCGALAVAADIDVLTGIAVAFPRSPMVTAAVAWELAAGQPGPLPPRPRRPGARPHQRRYGSDFDPPGPRLREYVLAVKQIFESFRTGTPLAVGGRVLRPLAAPADVGAGADRRAGSARRRRRGQPLDAPHGRAGGRRRPRAPAEPHDVPARDGAARTGGGRRPLGTQRRRPRGDRARLPLRGRHRGGAAHLAGDGAGPDRLLRVDAQLRLHLRAAGPRGHDRADPGAPAGRRRGRAWRR